MSERSIIIAALEPYGAATGPYKLIEPIGEGGKGSVWMAQQTEPVRRLVAVKLIKAGMDSRQVIARFEAERQALALGVTCVAFSPDGKSLATGCLRPIVPAQRMVVRAEGILRSSCLPWSLHALSLARYRNGEFNAAIELALGSKEGTWPGTTKALNGVVMAMAQFRLGHGGDERECLQQAHKLGRRANRVRLRGVVQPEMMSQDFVEFELPRREAEELINPKSKENPDKK